MGKNEMYLLGERLLEVLFPRKCPICEEILDRPKDLICDVCYKRLKFATEPLCKRCGRPIKDDQSEYCAECVKDGRLVKKFYDGGVSLLMHDDSAKKLIYDFKYSNIRENVELLAKEFCEKKGKDILYWKPEVIIPVPLHKKRYKKRGFNQAEIFAKEISKRLNIPVDTGVLERINNTLPQKQLDKNSRKKNIENSFKICDNIVKYKYTLLVDDIFTTGSTINECARILKDRGARNVYFATISIVGIR